MTLPTKSLRKSDSFVVSCFTKYETRPVSIVLNVSKLSRYNQITIIVIVIENLITITITESKALLKTAIFSLKRSKNFECTKIIALKLIQNFCKKSNYNQISDYDNRMQGLSPKQ